MGTQKMTQSQITIVDSSMQMESNVIIYWPDCSVILHLLPNIYCVIDRVCRTNIWHSTRI